MKIAMICRKDFSALKGMVTLLHKRNAVPLLSYSIAISQQNCTETVDNTVTGLQNRNKFKVTFLFIDTKVSFSDHITVIKLTVLLAELNEILSMWTTFFIV